ncbi:hypothetical protein GF322_05235 [Candidatus Dependentiae bacterium]|nr:hypothetical protein [Candidatus Dependentiae bacterium]
MRINCLKNPQLVVKHLWGGFLDTNCRREIINFVLTPGNVSDANVCVVNELCKKVFGKLFGDKNYSSKALFNRTLPKVKKV